MPDLMPDTSFYPHNAEKNPLSTMSIGDLVGMASRVREYNTKSAVSDALKKSGGDTGAALQDLLQNKSPGVIVDPAMVGDFAHAGQAQLGFNTDQMTAGVKIVSELLNTGRPISQRDIENLSPVLAGLHIPPKTIAAIVANPTREGLQMLRNALILNGGAETQVGIPTIGGTQNVPAGRANIIQRQGGSLPGGGENPQWTADLVQSGNYKRQVLPLEQAIPALARLGPGGTYAGADEVNKLKNILSSFGGEWAEKALGIDPNKTGDFQKAQKYLVDWANQNSAGGTNDRLAATFASNANTTMQNATAQTVAKTALSVARMKQAQVLEFKKTGLPPQAYPGWASDWNNKQDVRAYGFDMMTNAQREKLLHSKEMQPDKNGKPSAAYLKFYASQRAAEGNELHNLGVDWNGDQGGH